MNKTALWTALSTTLLLGGCAGIGKEDRVGLYDGSDPCFNHLDRLDDTAIYFKDQRMKDITAGVIAGAGTGALTAALAGGNTATLIASTIGGAMVGGFAADAYWKNQLQKANNQIDQATYLIENDIKQDINKLSTLDRDIDALVRCRTNQRDIIKKQFAERKITLQQAQEQWKKWGDLIRKDQNEMKYLNEALDNVRKIEDSYNSAATTIESLTVVTDDMQRKWQQELQMEKNKEIADADLLYKSQVVTKRITSKEKKKLKLEHKQKIAEINNQYVSKENSIKNKVNPKGNSTKVLASSFYEKYESVQKKKERFDNLALEAADNKGFEQINSQLPPIYRCAGIFA